MMFGFWTRIVSIVSGRRSSEQSISLVINCWAICSSRYQGR